MQICFLLNSWRNQVIIRLDNPEYSDLALVVVSAFPTAAVKFIRTSWEQDSNIKIFRTDRQI